MYFPVIFLSAALSHYSPVSATSIKIFQKNVISSLSPGMAANMEGRAFLWRGPTVVERNLYILNAFRNQDGMGQKM